MVALRKESVDRNKGTFVNCNCNFTVALRKESVDRNNPPIKALEVGKKSLSARRAWIEIKKVLTSTYMYGVALRKESVDRNSLLCRILFRR